MDSERFAEVIANQIRLSQDVLVDKGRQYAEGEDKLHNFRVAAALQDVTMMEALGGMMAKHTVSIYDMINSPTYFTLEQWDEKITDHINYLLILAAVLRDDEESEYILLDETENFVVDEYTINYPCETATPTPVAADVGDAWARFTQAITEVLTEPITIDKKRKFY